MVQLLSYLQAFGIARQYWRAWIETSIAASVRTACSSIARQYWRAWIETWVPVSHKAAFEGHRPPVLAGVD